MASFPAPTHLRPTLTRREIEVLHRWVRSESKTAAATKLGIGLGTVNTHLSRIRNKYAQAGRPAPDKATLLVRALQDQILTLAELDGV
ncbi:LuxR C-terminal-related transcriptional regulator [Rhodococcus sp. DK17]|jgi:DNA-binding CsgD family transcriptional regulator|uniref:LuxR C-terminal-related transcriptional regulator n=1 Tax=unclassified Rhodococcus (in: high G+C Gram-positive bacteria) TaxID=192944 RepID=UPI000370AC5B